MGQWNTVPISDRAETISGMIAHFKALLESVVSHPQEKIGRLKMLTEAEEQAIKKLSGETKVYAGDDQTVISIFEEQVSKTPEATALVFEREKVTYGDLNQRANGLADTLISSGVKQGDLVPLLMERGSEMITAILGIMKAGAGYVPIDTSFPEDRIAFMLEDSKAKVVVTTSEASSKLPSSYQGEQIDLNNIQQSTNNAQGLNNDQQQTTNNDQQQTGNNEKRETRNEKNRNANATAYVIYTSGSTGQPKRVMVSHRNLVDYTLGLEDTTRMSESRSFALVSTIATDLGNTVIYASLLFGGELHLFSNGEGVGAGGKMAIVTKPSMAAGAAALTLFALALSGCGGPSGRIRGRPGGRGLVHDRRPEGTDRGGRRTRDPGLRGERGHRDRCGRLRVDQRLLGGVGRRRRPSASRCSRLPICSTDRRAMPAATTTPWSSGSSPSPADDDFGLVIVNGRIFDSADAARGFLDSIAEFVSDCPDGYTLQRRRGREVGGRRIRDRAIRGRAGRHHDRDVRRVVPTDGAGLRTTFLQRGTRSSRSTRRPTRAAPTWLDDVDPCDRRRGRAVRGR